jgi:hypothetical protein
MLKRVHSIEYASLYLFNGEEVFNIFSRFGFTKKCTLTNESVCGVKRSKVPLFPESKQ